MKVEATTRCEKAQSATAVLCKDSDKAGCQHMVEVYRLKSGLPLRRVRIEDCAEVMDSCMESQLSLFMRREGCEYRSEGRAATERQCLGISASVLKWQMLTRP